MLCTSIAVIPHVELKQNSPPFPIASSVTLRRLIGTRLFDDAFRLSSQRGVHYAFTRSRATSEGFEPQLFERIYAPLAAGLLRPFSPDAKMHQTRCSQLDRLYARVISSLDKLLEAVGPKAA